MTAIPLLYDVEIDLLALMSIKAGRGRFGVWGKEAFSLCDLARWVAYAARAGFLYPHRLSAYAFELPYLHAAGADASDLRIEVARCGLDVRMPGHYVQTPGLK